MKVVVSRDRVVLLTRPPGRAGASPPFSRILLRAAPFLLQVPPSFLLFYPGDNDSDMEKVSFRTLAEGLSLGCGAAADPSGTHYEVVEVPLLFSGRAVIPEVLQEERVDSVLVVSADPVQVGG